MKNKEFIYFFVLSLLTFSFQFVSAQGYVRCGGTSGVCDANGNSVGYSEPTADGQWIVYNNNHEVLGTLDQNGDLILNQGEAGLANAIPGGAKSGSPNKKYDKNSDLKGGDACSVQLDATKKQCKGAEWAQYSSVALQLAASVAQQKNAGNIKAACETAQKINTLGGVANGAVAAMCARAVNSCKTACGQDASECTQFDSYAKLAGMQAIESATALVGSTACANAVAGKCIGDEAYNDEDCTQFCMKPGRQDHPKCKIALNNCSDSTYAAQNVQMCTCINNPLSPTCTSLANNPTASPSNLNLEDSGGSEFDFYGATGEGQAANVNTPNGGGGGGLGGGGGSFAFGDGGGAGGGAEPLNKDILTGTGGVGGGAGAIFGGGGGYADGQGGGRASGGSGSSDPNAIDLRAFLPGGKKDPSRNPASAGYVDPSITKANGLTNWQKITRKMNEKKPELMP